MSSSDIIPVLPLHHSDDPYIQFYVDLLRQNGFSGDCHLDYATRLLSATDNSVYQVLPKAVIYPKTAQDLNILVKTSLADGCEEVFFAPRGGGTGTNGQSLTTGIIVDTSKYLTQIKAFNTKDCVVTVQPGVVLDQLNAYLQDFGFFFPPNISTASRATVGGMTGTDASGKGSRIYGKVSDYIESLTVVLANGESWVSRKLSGTALQAVLARDDAIGHLHRQIYQGLRTHAVEIEQQFPKMNRGLTGYNLQHALQDDVLDLSYIFAGSEGSLGFIQEISFRVLPLPTYKGLVAIRYPSFNAALENVSVLLKADPVAVEVIDDKILTLAQSDIIWAQVERIMGGQQDSVPCMGVNFVEFTAQTQVELQKKIAKLCDLLQQNLDQGYQDQIIGWQCAYEKDEIDALWEMRKKSVGLLGGLQGKRRAIPFVEDTAVPPENLPSFIREFREILEKYGVDYGMFGHADVGCLHVRPTLDLCDAEDYLHFRMISDEVVALTLKYGGLLWGEHGKGYRGEYSPYFFGPVLYKFLQKIKFLIDPSNKFNPGKIASPFNVEGKQSEQTEGARRITGIDEVAFRADYDLDVNESLQEIAPKALQCNGNGACYNWDVSDPMCPSYKVSRNRLYSPKGRAGLMREWLRRLSLAQGADIESQGRGGHIQETEDFSHHVYQAFNSCLSCKACATQCPVKVDIPEIKSQFLAMYHRRYRRPLRDYIIAHTETLSAFLIYFGNIQNRLFQSEFFQTILRKRIGIVDLPHFRQKRLEGRWGIFEKMGVLKANPEYLNNLSEDQKRKTLLIILDSFTTYFEDDAPIAHIELLQVLGYDVFYIPCYQNGKALHVKGFLQQFGRKVKKLQKIYAPFRKSNIPIIAIDAATALLFRQEYAKLWREKECIQPLLLHEWLDQNLTSLLNVELCKHMAPFPETALFAHCSEKTALADMPQKWQKIFSYFGLKLHIVETGCCGMAGIYGHEVEHRQDSQALFEMSWQKPLAEFSHQNIAVTGFSCRCQMKRFAGSGSNGQHPARILREYLSPKG